MRFCILLLSIFLCSFAEAQRTNLTTRSYLLKRYLTRRDAKIIRVFHGILEKERKQHLFQLERNSCYNVFLLSNISLDDIKMAMALQEGRSLRSHNHMILPFQKRLFSNMGEFIHWDVMTFQRPKGIVEINSPKYCEYIIIVSTRGRMRPIPFVRNRAVASSGKLYELSHGIIFRNSRQYYISRNHYIVSICVSNDGNLFMRTSEGAVISKTRYIHRPYYIHKRAILMVSTKSKVYILLQDGTVMNRYGRVVYRGIRDFRAVDLLEKNHYIWIVTYGGQRRRP